MKVIYNILSYLPLDLRKELTSNTLNKEVIVKNSRNFEGITARFIISLLITGNSAS